MFKCLRVLCQFLENFYSINNFRTLFCFDVYIIYIENKNMTTAIVNISKITRTRDVYATLK